MSLELNDLPRYVFQSSYLTNQALGWRYGDNSISAVRKFMEVPINTDIFEIPVLAMSTFIDMVRNCQDTREAIIVELYSREKDLRYVSVDRYMRDVLVDNFVHNRLLKCIAKTKDGTVKYYGTHGAVFDGNFKPVAMCSWIMKREFQPNDRCEFEAKYRFLRPVFRIHPSIYINPQDTMEKFLVKKFATIYLTETLHTPLMDNLSPRFILTNANYDKFPPSIYIERSPFSITTISEPTIDTTNEELRNTALEHINEVIQ